MMADGGAARCLSDLSDDLLRHILFLAPDSEGASTAVLSRRWRWLWRTSGAVFLDGRSFIGDCSSPDQERESLLRGAEKALAAAAAVAHGHIRRLTLFIVEDSKEHLMRQEDKLMEALISNPAARRVEDLKIVVVRRFRLCFGSLPSEALRVLRLTGCSNLTAPLPGAAEFPLLVELHLTNCDVFLVDFKKLINAAPQLSTLHLKSSTLSGEKDPMYYEIGEDDDDELYTFDDDNDGGEDDDDDDDDDHDDHDEKLFGRLLLPAVTTLMVEDCNYGHKSCMSLSLEMDVQRLQYFRYRGHVRTMNHLWLKSQVSSNMIEVDLDLTSDKHVYIDDTTTPSRDLFRQFIRNFSTTKFLKLKLDFTKDHFAVEDKAGQEELLGGLTFQLLDQLELEAQYVAGFERPLIVMLANLLHSCPMVRDLRLKLRKQHEMPWVRSTIDKEDRVHLERSVDRFRNHRRPMVSLGGEDDDNYSQAFDIISCLTGEHSCLHSHLKRVSLQFFMDEPNCLGVQLAKFFAEKAMVLQEIHIDDGCHELLEHVNPTVRRWIAKTDTVSNKQLNVKD